MITSSDMILEKDGREVLFMHLCYVLTSAVCFEACRPMWSNSHFFSFILLMQIAINKCVVGILKTFEIIMMHRKMQKKKKNLQGGPLV